MKTPNIRYYARLSFDPMSKKTPKFVITDEAGFYEPMEALRGRNSKISMFLMDKLKEGANVPSMRLQAKGSLNFTGLKDYFIDGKLSGYAYGYPDDREIYSSKKKLNPFYKYKDDGFLFIIKQSRNSIIEAETLKPDEIELIVLEGAKVLISSYCKQLVMGGFDEALEHLREQAKKESPI